MADEIRVGRPMGTGQSMAADMRDYSPRGGSRAPWVILVLVVVVLVVLGVLFRDKLFGGSGGTSDTGTSSGYQAVFLTNNQVYFGKLSDASGQYVTLSDIYYLQVTQPPLQGSQNPGQTPAAQQAQPQLSLVKLGQELHGPVDSMQINRDQILFYEDIKEDGRVMKAIREYQKNPPANQNTQQTPGNTTPPANTTPNQ